MHTLDVDPTTHDVYVYENNRNTVDVYGQQSQLHAEFRFFDTKTGDHFFTTSVDELNQIIKNVPEYHYEGVVGSTRRTRSSIRRTSSASTTCDDRRPLLYRRTRPSATRS